MRITFRPHDEPSDAPDRRAFGERCCAFLTDRYGRIPTADLSSDARFGHVHLDVTVCTDRRFRQPEALPPLAAVSSVIRVPTRVQFVPHLIHDDDELEHLIIGAVLVGVTGVLRRNPALSAAAQRVIHAMSSHDIGGREPTAD